MPTIHVVTITLSRREPLPSLLIKSEALSRHAALRAAMGESCRHYIEGRRAPLWRSLADMLEVYQDRGAIANASGTGWAVNQSTVEHDNWTSGAIPETTVEGGF